MFSFRISEYFWRWLYGHIPIAQAPTMRVALESPIQIQYPPNPNDPAIEAMTVIDTYHAKVHRGAGYHVDVSAVLDNNSVLDLIITTAPDYSFHANIKLALVGDAKLWFVEDTAVTGDYPVVLRNKNRTLRGVASTTASFRYGLLTPHGGTALIGDIPVTDGFLLPGGKTAQSVSSGMENRLHDEEILGDAGSYMVRIQNVSGQTRFASITVSGYEDYIGGKL